MDVRCTIFLFLTFYFYSLSFSAVSITVLRQKLIFRKHFVLSYKNHNNTFLTIKLIPYGFSWNVYFGTFAIILENLLIKKVWRLWLKKFLQICLHIVFRKKSITASQPWDFAKLLAWENSKQKNYNGNCYFLSLKIIKSIS